MDHVDFLVANAGIQELAPFLDMTKAQWHDVIDIHLSGTSYAASKWGTIGLMKSLAMDLGKHQITANALVPGVIDTSMTQNGGRWKEAYQDYVVRSRNCP